MCQIRQCLWVLSLLTFLYIIYFFTLQSGIFIIKKLYKSFIICKELKYKERKTGMLLLQNLFILFKQFSYLWKNICLKNVIKRAVSTNFHKIMTITIFPYWQFMVFSIVLFIKLNHKKMLQKSSIFFLLALFLLITTSKSRLSVDFVIPYNTAVFQCIKSSGFNLVTLRAVLKESIDPNGMQNLNNAKNAGLQADISVLSCRSRNISDQVNDLKKVSKSLYNRLWIRPDVITNDNKCLWTNHTKQQNCQYLKSLISGFKDIGLTVGVYTDNNEWAKIFGDTKYCDVGTGILLWWSGPDGRTGFDNYQQIANWKIPTRKLFKEQAVVCGVTMNMNNQN